MAGVLRGKMDERSRINHIQEEEVGHINLIPFASRQEVVGHISLACVCKLMLLNAHLAPEI